MKDAIFGKVENRPRYEEVTVQRVYEVQRLEVGLVQNEPMILRERLLMQCMTTHLLCIVVEH